MAVGAIVGAAVGGAIVLVLVALAGRLDFVR